YHREGLPPSKCQVLLTPIKIEVDSSLLLKLLRLQKLIFKEFWPFDDSLKFALILILFMTCFCCLPCDDKLSHNLSFSSCVVCNLNGLRKFPNLRRA
uniref:Uncharacterized protein n=1 Tax=Glossina brevipalpis TaxID=37001 RepID=A0A1A9WER7_9MUSC